METVEVFRLLSELLMLRREIEGKPCISDFARGRAVGEVDGILKAIEMIVDANCI